MSSGKIEKNIRMRTSKHRDKDTMFEAMPRVGLCLPGHSLAVHVSCPVMSSLPPRHGRLYTGEGCPFST